MDNTRLVVVPRLREHDGYVGNRVEIRLKWICPVCGGPRGETFDTLSYDGSRRLGVTGWVNPCGHIDKYVDCIKEAAEVELAVSP